MSEQIHVDSAALAELREVMEEEFSILLETYLNDSKDRIQQLLDAVAKQDAEDYSRAAHSFKGSCTNIGVPYLAELCLEAETRGKAGSLDGAESLVGKIRAEFAVVASQLEEFI